MCILAWTCVPFLWRAPLQGNPEGQSMLASTITPLPQGSAAAKAGGRVSPPPSSLMQRWAQGLGRGPGKGEDDSLSLSFGG